MSSATWPDHLLTLEDWIALPEDDSRCYELVEGVLHVSHRPASWHQWLIAELLFQVRSQLPRELVVQSEVEVVVVGTWPPTVRVPDVLVVDRAVAARRPARFQAADVRLAVEINSPGTVRTDRVAKSFEYADAGIEHYWIVDAEDPVTMSAYRLVDGEYEIVAEGSGLLELSEPATLRIDLSEL